MALLLLVSVAQVAASGSAVPQLSFDQRATLLFRVLAYDRNLLARAPGAVSIGVFLRPSSRETSSPDTRQATALEASAATLTVGGRSVRIVRLAWVDLPTFEAAAAANRFAAVLVSPGMDEAIDPLLSVTRARRILTFSGSEADVRAGISIGILARENRPSIIVHIRSARAEGTDLDPALLRLAERVESP